MGYLKTNIAVIGAGVSGITAARHLQSHGLATMVIEKSRGVGGRLSTRLTRNGYVFDHGAPYFSATSAAFRHTIDSGDWSDTVTVWSPGAHPSAATEARYVGTPQMKQPILAASERVDVLVNTTVVSLARDGAHWVLSCDGVEQLILADNVIVAVPSVQAQALTTASPKLQSAFTDIQMDPCWALMVAFDEPTNTDFSYIDNAMPVFSWIAKDSSKPGRQKRPETWVAHANAAWSREHLEFDQDSAIASLMPAFKEYVPSNGSNPAYIAAHRWRYAKVARAAGRAFLSDETESLFAIGDWCLGPRVECAFESGLAVAQCILSREGQHTVQ